MTGTLHIRPMALADCRAVAEIRVGGWQTAYAGLVPRPYLDAMDVAEDADRRRESLLKPGNPVVSLVAEGARQVIGWAAYGPYREGEVRTEDTELYALYVRPGQIGSGVGSALMRETIDRCATAGHPRMLLWVLKENTRARRLYEHHGFTADGAEEPFEVDGAMIPEVRYVRRAR